METAECFRLLIQRWQRELVVCTLGSVTHEWYGITKNDRAFHMHAMGLAAPFALGLALTRPETPVWLMDSDGGLSLSLGSLLAEARHQPRNLVHFVIDNGVYQAVGGYPIVNAGQTDYSGMAKAAGMKRCFTFETLTEFRDSLNGILGAGEHSFVVLRVPPKEPPHDPVPFEGPEIKYRFARHVEDQEGISILGPHGY